jgi:hypothetical protein
MNNIDVSTFQLFSGFFAHLITLSLKHLLSMASNMRNFLFSASQSPIQDIYPLPVSKHQCTLRFLLQARHQWFMPLILATWEDEIQENHCLRPAPANISGEHI